MSEVKYTKNELRSQQEHLNRFQKYLPTLQLKKSVLQVEVFEAEAACKKREEEWQKAYEEIKEISHLLAEDLGLPPHQLVQIKEIEKKYENIAGVEVPVEVAVHFSCPPLFPIQNPPWVKALSLQLQKLLIKREEWKREREKLSLLKEALHSVSILVNLFEKRLIPRAIDCIGKIKVFFGDQELTAIARAKVAKRKIVQKKE